MCIRLYDPKMGNMEENPIYPMAPVIFSWELLEKQDRGAIK
jgi:hypothetical protein